MHVVDDVPAVPEEELLVSVADRPVRLALLNLLDNLLELLITRSLPTVLALIDVNTLVNNDIAILLAVRSSLGLTALTRLDVSAIGKKLLDRAEPRRLLQPDIALQMRRTGLRALLTPDHQTHRLELQRHHALQDLRRRIEDGEAPGPQGNVHRVCSSHAVAGLLYSPLQNIPITEDVYSKSEHQYSGKNENVIQNISKNQNGAALASLAPLAMLELTSTSQQEVNLLPITVIRSGSGGFAALTCP